MKYPPSVLTKNSKGEAEVRNLLEHGEFVRYNYIDPETGRTMESGKMSIILKSSNGREHLFLVPLKNGRFLAIPDSDASPRNIWNGRKAIRF